MFHPITIDGPEVAMKINKLATQEDYPIMINDSITSVDARSLLALFALIGRTVNLTAPDHIDTINFIKLIQKIN